MLLNNREMYLKLVDAGVVKPEYTAEQIEQIRYPRFRNIIRDEVCDGCHTNFLIDDENGLVTCFTCGASRRTITILKELSCA